MPKEPQSLLNEVTLKIEIARWVERSFLLQEAVTLSQFLKELVEGTAKIESFEDKPEPGQRMLSIMAPNGVNVDVQQGFDFTLADYTDQKLLYDKVMQKMRKGVAHFSYETVANNKVIERFGSLSERVVPPKKNITGLMWGVKDLNTAQVYWDVEMQDFRSFVPNLLITVV